jgi:hypothetical protein
MISFLTKKSSGPYNKYHHETVGFAPVLGYLSATLDNAAVYMAYWKGGSRTKCSGFSARFPQLRDGIASRCHEHYPVVMHIHPLEIRKKNIVKGKG